MRRFWLACLLVVGGCITPSIPIPPPEARFASFTLDVGGTAQFAYAGDERFADAVVYVFNRDRGVGVIETADGTGQLGPTAPFAAVVGDEVVVTFERADDSVSACFVVKEGTPDPFDPCRAP